MFIRKQSDKEVVMQLDLDENMLWEEELIKLVGTKELPDSLICSDGSVIVGCGNMEIQKSAGIPALRWSSSTHPSSTSITT